MTAPWRNVQLGEVLTQERNRVVVDPRQMYSIAGVRIAGRGLFWRETISGSTIKYTALYRLREGQLVYRKLTAWEGPITVVPSDFDGAFVSPEFPTFTIDRSELLPEFLRCVCQQPSFHNEMRARSTGTAERRNRLAPPDLLEIDIELPPLDEQRAIVEAIQSVSDAETACRRSAGAAALLFRAASRHAFERVDAPEIELGQIARVTSGGTPARQRPEFYGGDIPWVKTGEVNFNVLEDTDEHITTDALTSSAAKLFPAGTILIAMYGQGATRGRCAILGREMATNQACAAVLPSNRLRSEFLFYWLWSQYDELREESEGSAQDNLNAEIISSLSLPIPMLHVQDEIIHLLKGVHQAARTEQMEADAHDSFRKALIDELVSGARRVRIYEP